MIRFSPPIPFCVLLGLSSIAICIAFVFAGTAVYAADHLGPVFPRNSQNELAFPESLPEPLPLPNRNPLLQRPQSQQVVFDSLDPIGSIVAQNLIYDEDFDPQPQIVRQRQVPNRRNSTADAGNVIFTDEGMMVDDYSQLFETNSLSSDTYITGPFPVAFGMGFFDNITVFTETTAFKTGLSGGAGSFGISEGANWSAAMTPQGTVTGQYGVRAVQADLFAEPIRSQLFMTAGIFRRFDRLPIQGGVAFDWFEDRTRHFGPVKLRQMRCELATRSLGRFEIGFAGAFNVFNDKPTIWDVELPDAMGVYTTAPQDYCLLFFRKYLDNGGQVELRCGATTYGDFIFNALGEVAVSDRIAVNGGLSFLAPAGGHSVHGDYLESWSMSMGVIIYLRGGAVFRQANAHRSMFNVAGNNSFFTKAIYW